ncbi:MAG: NAD(P)/FAD-dependent oxidoreductase [bacterium]
MTYDCIIIGAGPGGLQAAVYLGRFNRRVLLIDRSGGRTRHAKHIENFLTHKSISGNEMIDLGIEQAKSFNVRVEHDTVTTVNKGDTFEVSCGEKQFLSRFVIVSSGATENIPQIENIYKFFALSVFTCVDCDGYRTTGKKLVIIGNSPKTVTLALAMKEMFTADITVILYFYQVPPEFRQELDEARIRLLNGRPIRFLGDDNLTGVEMESGEIIECEMALSHFGFKLNDRFLKNLNLKKDREDFKYVTNRAFESSLSGLYIVGPLNEGNDQAIIAAGEGAVAAIDINKRLIEFSG